MKEATKPIVHKEFKHLNKKITILGYPPIIGALLLLMALILVLFSYAYKKKMLIILAILYVPIFIWYTIKNYKVIEENRLDTITLLFFESKRTIYIDHNSVINKIKENNEKH